MGFVLNQKKAIALLEAHGWNRTVGGNHETKMVKRGERPITLPVHRRGDYSKSLTASILRQARLSRKDIS